ncbi:MAG: sulfite exporter TauE/SafE family protein, partial [Pseudomonadota bacterium]
MSLLAIAAGLATGLMLGLFGSGGSIITLPALMYLLGVEAKPAIAMSLG